jgi:prepilin peptidase CpaA
MQGGYFTYGLLVALAIALLVAAFTDLRSRHIHNKLNAAIALCAPLFWLVQPDFTMIDVAWQIGVALLTLVVLAGFFAMGWKPGDFVSLIIYMAIIGGVLTLAFGAWHIARRQRDRLVIPYGVAIAAAGIIVLFPVLQQGVLFG